jgi:hypothetical protein
MSDDSLPCVVVRPACQPRGPTIVSSDTPDDGPPHTAPGVLTHTFRRAPRPGIVRCAVA